jgi:N-alpha-acetyl-L-2,4-diaminobutyrate deacetylase
MPSELGSVKAARDDPVGKVGGGARRVANLPAIESLAPASRHAFRLAVVDGPDGPVEIPVNISIGNRPGPRLVAVAGVHGNEVEGPAALIDVWDELRDVSFAGAVVVVPVANAPAFKAARRMSPQDGLDMNRIFPGRPDGTLTERIASRLFEDVVLGADFLLSMHSWYAGAIVLPYIEVPRSGPTAVASRAAARTFGPQFVEPLDWHPGLLVSAAGRAGIPAMEPEIGGLGASFAEQRTLYRSGLRNLLKHLGMIPGHAEMEEAPRLVTRTAVTTPSGGFLRPLVDVGAAIRVGALIAQVCDLNGFGLVDVAAPASGVIAALQLAPAVEPGDEIAVIFRPGDVA